MSVDIPRAWQICRATAAEFHHPKCSYAQASMLCDCDVLNKHPEHLSKTFYGEDGKVLKLFTKRRKGEGGTRE